MYKFEVLLLKPNRTNLVASIKGIRCVKLALGLAAAIWQRGRSHERLMMMNLGLSAHRATVGLPLAGAAKSVTVSMTMTQLEIGIALG